VFPWNFDILSAIFCGEWLAFEAFFGKRSFCQIVCGQTVGCQTVFITRMITDQTGLHSVLLPIQNSVGICSVNACVVGIRTYRSNALF